jgi:PAS domain S-box-containing protein
MYILPRGVFEVEENCSKKYCCQRLVEIEERYNKILQFSSDAVFIHNDGLIVYVNAMAIKLMEADSEEELLNKNILDFIHKDYHEVVKKRIKFIREVDEIVPAREEDFITVKGKTIHLEVIATSIPFNGLRHNIIFARNITERKKLQEAKQKRELILRRVIENTLDLLIMCNKEGNITFATPSHYQVLGYKPEELIGGNSIELVHPEDLEGAKEVIKYTFGGHGNKIFRWRCRCKDGSYKYLESYTKPVFTNNKPDGVVISSRDLTDRKRAEEIEKSMEEQSRQLQEVVEYDKFRTEFFANISHELRTPINVIFSTIQLINLNINQMDMAYSDNEKLKKYMDIMKQNCNRLIRIINNLIDVSKIESGYFDLKLTNNNIISLVENITLSVVEYAESKGIELIFDTEVEEKIIACDLDAIERIMLNLISNALKFTEPGGKIFVNIFDKEDRIIISVKDTGIGICQEKQGIIFERFVQGDKTITRKQQGSGIGLSLVKSLVKLHKGDISLKSKLGEGSEFIIELPVTLVEGSDKEAKLKRMSYEDNIEKVQIEFSDIY